MRKFLSLSIAGCLLLPSGVFAAQLPEVRTARVSYADLDIRSPAGQRALDRRLAGAARHVCGPQDGDLYAAHAGRRCVQQSLANAHLQVGQAIALAQLRNPAATVLLASR